MNSTFYLDIGHEQHTPKGGHFTIALLSHYYERKIVHYWRFSRGLVYIGRYIF